MILEGNSLSISLCSEAIHNHREGDAPSPRRLRNAQSDWPGSIWRGKILKTFVLSSPLFRWTASQIKQPFGMLQNAGKSPLKSLQTLPYCVVCFGISSFVFMTHFAFPTKTPEYQRGIRVALKHLIDNRKLTPSSHLIFPSLPLPILRGPSLVLDWYSWAGTNLGILDGWFVLQQNVLLVPEVKDVYYYHTQSSFLFLYNFVFCNFLFCSTSTLVP